MYLTLRPDTSRDYLLDTLRGIHNNVSNLYTGGPPTQLDRLRSYLEWADEAAGLLAPLIRAKDIDSLIYTRRYEQIFARLEILAATDLARLTNSMLNIELKERTDEFARTVETLDRAIRYRVDAELNVVFDTSMFFRHPDKLAEVDFRAITKVYQGTVNLMIPMAVIDELDRLKESRDRHVRWRAGHTLGLIDSLFQTKKPFAVFHKADFSRTTEGELPRPEVTVEILFDPPGHIRLPDVDDEIIDRALAVQPLAASPVKLFTYDTGQSTRARNLDLAVEKLTLPAEPEPEGAAKS